MKKEFSRTLGDDLFENIDSNEYLNELYEAILYNYSLQLFKLNDREPREFNIDHALRFADILSKSTSTEKGDKHKIWSQEIVALLRTLYPDNKSVEYYVGSVLTNTGNYYGISTVVPNFSNLTLMDEAFSRFCKEYMKIPAEPDKQFLQPQKEIYDRFEEPYLSYSAPTSMGKSFIMRMFIKKKIIDGDKLNFALLVPTKALINEVSSKVINDLKELLSQCNYRVLTAAGSLDLEQNKNHNYIFVVTPERMLYLLIGNPEIHIDYLFVDEAHKISSKDDRSSFYFDVVSMLCQQKPQPHFIFASPNIPNPEIYLKLVPDATVLSDHREVSTFSPVSQVKYLVDLVDHNVRLYNSYTESFSYITKLDETSLEQTIRRVNRPGEQNIIYCSSTTQAIENARNYAKGMPDLNIPELDALARDIQNEVHNAYYLAELIKKGVAYHIGYLPSTIRMRIEEMFTDKRIKIIFCTSTLVEGVNLPADNLFITNYKNGTSYMTPVDFRNLIGRVGRIDFGLYGNVFLVRMSKNVQTERYEKLLKEKVPEQKLSVVSELTKPQKELVVDCLCKGNIELLKHPKNQTADNYSLMRKFALILLRDISKDWNTAVRREFEPFLQDGKEEKIREQFCNRRNKPDDDINLSVDQSDNLYRAIAGGLHYPSINQLGRVDYDELVDFLEKLCRIFKWEKYESKTLGKLSRKGEHAMLKWYAVILAQWVQGTGLSNIMDKAIEYKEQHKKASVMINGKLVDYDGSQYHKNVVIADTLKVIENVILFSISNYFLRFSEEYKKQHPDQPFQDWYEYVEYGTINQLTITLQRSGFSREASTYIKQHRSEYVTGTNEDPKLKKSIQQCGSISVCKEVADTIYNVPELFVD